MVTIIRKGSSKEEIRKRIDKAIAKKQKKNIMQYAGKLKIKIDPLEYQKKIRDEWR
ncbi:MAG: hypothetical protein K9I94_08045 [Bacteroidales bacterium]|nr:hypothetical protein [Bacteroidales bacterium]